MRNERIPAQTKRPRRPGKRIDVMARCQAVASGGDVITLAACQKKVLASRQDVKASCSRWSSSRLVLGAAWFVEELLLSSRVSLSDVARKDSDKYQHWHIL